jgi:hypothetical protein
MAAGSVIGSDSLSMKFADGVTLIFPGISAMHQTLRAHSLVPSGLRSAKKKAFQVPVLPKRSFPESVPYNNQSSSVFTELFGDKCEQSSLPDFLITPYNFSEALAGA